MPGSWEITKQRDERLLVAIICPPDLGVTLNFSQNMRNIQLPPGSDFMKVIGLPYGPARNQALKACVEQNYNLAFLDADVRIESDAFMKLLETKLDIVSGLYYQRFHPYMPVMFNEGRNENGESVRVPVIGWKPGDVVPCDFIPSGLTIYRLNMLRAMLNVYPLPFMWGVDIAPVPDVGGSVAPAMSEDFSFSWKAKQIGYRGYVMTSVVGLHETRAVIGPKWLIPAPSPDPTNGMIGVV